MKQFLRFNVVGMLGAVVQLTMLFLFTRGFGVRYVGATVAAVEVALLHNFCWHEMWTWQELPWRGWQARLLRFQMGNGVTSMASNAGLTFAFHEYVKLPVLAANVAAIAITALLNFGLARFWVFRATA